MLINWPHSSKRCIGIDPLVLGKNGLVLYALVIAYFAKNEQELVYTLRYVGTNPASV